jgi:hypothetical protein
MRWIFALVLSFLMFGSGISQDSLSVEKPFSMEFFQESLDDGWWEVISYDGKFRVTVPGKMQLKSDTLLTDIGKLNYHVFYHEHFTNQGGSEEQNPENNLLFLLSIYEYPDRSIHSDSISLLDNYFEATIEGATQGVRGELIYSDDINLKGYPGKVWRINYNGDKDLIRTHAYLVKQRLYLLSVVSNKAFSINTANDRFFNSFRFFE